MERRARFLLHVLGGADEQAAEEGLSLLCRALAKQRGLAEEVKSSTNKTDESKKEKKAGEAAAVTEPLLLTRLANKLVPRPTPQLLRLWGPCLPVALDLLCGREDVLRRATWPGAAARGQVRSDNSTTATKHNLAGLSEAHVRAA